MVVCAIVGCGLMGCKIAGELALHGHRVRVFDSDTIILNSVYDRMKEDKRDLLQEGLLLQPVFTGSVLCVSRLDECLRGVDIVFEAVPDDWEMKVSVLEEISALAPENAVVATNTLRLDVQKLSTSIRNPQRFIGIRFLFPVYFIPEVEVTLAGAITDQQYLAIVRSLLESMGKTLFFRSGSEPLILSEEQRNVRWEAARQNIWQQSSGLATSLNSAPDVGLASSLCSTTGFPSYSTQASSAATECAICMEGQRDCLLEPCRHLVLCKPCANLLLSRGDYCPMCRARISSISDVYLC